MVAHLACKFIRMGLLTAELCWNIGLRLDCRNGAASRLALECRHPIGNDWTAQRSQQGNDQTRQKERFMAKVEAKLAELGIVLPTPASPIANYVGFVRTGSLLVVSGQICLGADGKLVAKGKLGDTVSVEDGQKAARACAINLLAQVKVALGDLDKVVRVVRLGGFINSDADLPRRPEGDERRLRPDGRGVRRQGPPRPHHRRRRLAAGRRGGRGRGPVRSRREAMRPNG